MRRRTIRGLRLCLATLMVGTCLQAIAPQGCLGVLQQNLEVLLALDAVGNGPELYDSWVWQFLKN